MRGRSIRGAIGLLACLIVTIGCSGNRTATVTGTIMVDGKPAEKGSIAFIPADGNAQTTGCEIKEGGKYTARVPVGMAKVQIRVPKVIGTKKLYDTPDSPVQNVLEEVLPDKYNNQTELLFDVQPGKNEKDWDLKSKQVLPAN